MKKIKNEKNSQQNDDVINFDCELSLSCCGVGKYKLQDLNCS